MQNLVILLALAAAALPHFEVASVNPCSASPGSPGQYIFSAGRVTMEKATLKNLIQSASKPSPWQLLGGPGWVNGSTFNVTAKAGSKATTEEMRPMLQALLEERFALKAHRET